MSEDKLQYEIKVKPLGIMKHTHSFIKSKWLRAVYASELWQMRILLRVATPEEKRAMKLGLESGIWAVQKSMMRDMK